MHPRILAVITLALPLPPPQVIEEDVIPLFLQEERPLPNWIQNASQGQVPRDHNLVTYTLVTGDVDGDGMEDAVISNALAFMRVYYLDTTQASPVVKGVEDVLPYGIMEGGVYKGWDVSSNGTNLPTTWTCEDTGEKARFLTIKQNFRAERPLVYDIDLDGTSEIIYLEHISSSTTVGNIGLRIYKYDNGSIQPEGHQQRPLGDLIDNGPNGFFFTPTGGDHCNPVSSPSDDGFPEDELNLRMVNIRGRAIPQDILVWSSHPSDAFSFKIFGYDSNANGPSSLVLLASHTTANKQSPQNTYPWNGDPGHNWRAADINFDGRDEIVGKQVLAFVLNNQTCEVSTPITKWGMTFTHIAKEGVEPWDYGNHPDHIVALDFVSTYLDENGRQIPAPGYEIFAAPQTEGATTLNNPDKSGPWMYRAVTGHSSNLTEKREWPRRILNAAKSSDGDAYWFPSKTSWEQPAVTSNWDDLGMAFPPSMPQNTNPDTQAMIVGQFLSAEQGLELLCFSKGDLTGNQCVLSGEQSAHFLFGSTSELRALGWGENSQGSPAPYGSGAYAIDFCGDRSEIEVHTTAGCDPTVPASRRIFGFQSNSEPSPPYRPYVIAGVQPVYPQAGLYSMHSGIYATDIMGDSREELMLVLLKEGTTLPGAYDTAEVKILSDVQVATRPANSPLRYLKYRQRAFNQAYNDFINYDSFDGLRFMQDILPRGSVGSLYGACQDQALDDQVSSSFVGAVLLAEGGSPPYAYELVSGRLPAGLTATDIVSEGYSEGLLISGTPSEFGSHRLEYKVSDAAMTETTKTYWISISPNGGTDDRQPFIYKGGFNGAYLTAGGASTVTFEIWVDSPSNPNLTVRVYDEYGVFLGSLPHKNEDKYMGTLDVGPGGPSEVRRYTVQASFTDASNNVLRSNTWPYLPVAGGDGLADLAWVDASPPTQPENKTPLINYVALQDPSTAAGYASYPSFLAGEVGDDSPEVQLKVHLRDRRGLPVTKIEAVIGHPLAGDEAITRFSTTNIYTGGTSNLYIVDFPATVFEPEGQFGWGDYTINVRVTTTDPLTMAEYRSDWWPQLAFH